MLTQSLVQNKIIGFYDSDDKFQIIWVNAAKILNLNFFYQQKLIEESSQYRALLKPWEQIAPLNDITQLQNISDFPVHTFFYSNFACLADPNNNIPVNIYVGSLVACVGKSTDNKPQIAVINPLLAKYDYNEDINGFEFNTQLGAPSRLRSGYLMGLYKTEVVTLDPENSNLIINNDTITYMVTNTSNHWYYRFNFMLSSMSLTTNSPLLFSKDIIFCRIKWNDDIIYDTITTITRKYNPATLHYEYYVTIPNHNFPMGSILEYY